MTDQTLESTTTKYHAGDIVRASAGFVAVVDHGDWEKGIYRLSSGSAQWKAVDLSPIATTHTFPIYLYVALCKAFDAQDKDLNGQTLETKPGAGWRPHHQVGGAKNADRLVELGFYEIDAAGRGKDKPVVNAEGPRYRITALGREVRNAMKHKEGNDVSHFAILTSPELTPDETRKAQIIADVMGFDDDEDEAAPDFTITPLEEVVDAIDGIVAAAIGHQQPVEITHVADNVQALADAYFAERGRAAAMTLEIDKLTRQINALKLAADQARHALPMPNELTDLRAQVKRLEEENAQLHTAQTRQPQPSAPTTPEIEVVFWSTRLEERKRSAKALAALRNEGWMVAFEVKEGYDLFVHLERNKPTAPDQPRRAAAEDEES